MSAIKWFTTSVLCIVVLHSVDAFEVREPYPLRQYQSYANVHFSEFIVPESTSSVGWTFRLLIDPEDANRDCEDVNATVYLQQGGFPVFSAENESFPSDFMFNKSYTGKVSLNSRAENNIRGLIFSSPSAGRWFAASYLEPMNKPAAIQPKGIASTPCTYYLRTTMNHRTVDPQKQYLLNVEKNESVLTEKSLTVLRYFIRKHTYRYTVGVTDCKVLVPAGDSCQFSLWVGGDSVHTSRTSLSVDCNWQNMSSECLVNVDMPMVDRWHYAFIDSYNDSISLLVTILIRVESCVEDLPGASRCDVKDYYTDTLSGSPYTADFLPQTRYLRIPVRDDRIYHASFSLDSLIHSGGTLGYTVTPSPAELPPSVTAVLYSCISAGRFSDNITQVKWCALANNVTTSYGLNTHSKTYIPYPRDGIWYVSVMAQCYNTTTNTHIDCTSSLYAYMNISLRPCIDRLCGEYGSCYMYYSGVVHWSACKCKAGYRGYGCTDGTEAISDSIQLLQTLLLTLSNILFAFAGFWAIYRKWFSEALIYFFVLFASSFYHACDNGTIYTLCVLDYSVLQYCDFYGSILAVWITAMALSRLPDKLRSFLHVAGVLGVLIGTQVTLLGLWNFVIPLLIALVILATSWVRLCKAERSCYPRLKVWLIQILPGGVCALTGLALYSFVETEANYFYVHSIWHLLMALSILFLLPRDKTLRLASIKKFICCWRVRPVRRNETADESSAAGDNLPVLPSDSNVSTNTESI